MMMSFLFCNLIGAQTSVLFMCACARIQNGIGSRPAPRVYGWGWPAARARLTTAAIYIADSAYVVDHMSINYYNYTPFCIVHEYRSQL